MLRVAWGLERGRKRLEKAMARLDAASPLNILKRGYSITQTWPDKTIVREARTLSLQQALNITLAQGEILCRVEKIKKD